MKYSFFILTWTVLSLSVVSQAQTTHCTTIHSEPVGYSINNKDLELLKTNLWLPSTRSEPTAQILEKITAYMNMINPKASPHLPSLILLTANVTQLDPYFLTALIKKESTFDPTRISSGSAYGLTQLTGNGLNEVRNQLGVFDPNGRFKRFKPLQADFFNSEVLKFFTAMHQWRVMQTKKPSHLIALPAIQKSRYLNWLQTTEDSIIHRRTLHSRDDYALITGALILRINLAKSNNNYRIALIKYNGDKKHQDEYSRIIVNDQNSIRNYPVSCEFDDPVTKDVLFDTCEITQDKDFCEQFLGWQST